MHPFRPRKPMIRICGIVGRNGCIALHYYVHFLRIFLFRHSWDRKWGYWCKICTVPHSVCVMHPFRPTLSSRCFRRLKEFFRLCKCRFDCFGMLVLLLVKCLPRMSLMTSIKELGVSKMQCLKPEMKPETKKPKKKSKPEMVYLQVCTRTCSTVLISHHSNVEYQCFKTL